MLAQQQDKCWKPMYDHIIKFRAHWEHEKVGDLSEEVRCSMSEFDKNVYDTYRRNFLIDDDGVLRKRKKLKKRNKVVEYLTICVPDALVTGVLRHFHGSPLTGHLGSNKLQAILECRFHWPGMWKSIKKWVSGCAPCQRRKQHRPIHQGLLRPTVSSRPWQRACMDLVGPLPETDDHNRYLDCHGHLFEMAARNPTTKQKG